MTAQNERRADDVTVVVTHWRAVSDEGGIAFDLSTRDEGTWGGRGLQRVKDFCDKHSRYHLEVWEQEFAVSPSKWTRVDGTGSV